MATTTLPEAEVQPVSKSATKYVYFFGGSKADGNGKMKDELGGKGAGLAEMTNAGLPVPPGFTIQFLFLPVLPFRLKPAAST